MHKMLVSVLCLFAAMSASGLSFSAQTALTGTTPAKEESFTLEQYIAKYLAGSPRLQAETNSLKIARNTYKNAFTSAFLPSFYLSANASENYGRNYHYSSWEDFEHGDSYGQAQASWNLFNSGKDTLNYKSASLEWQIAKINYDSTVQQHVLDAVQTYYDLLLSQKLLAVYEDDLAVAQKQYEQDSTLYENGLKTRSDLLSSETNWRSSQLSLFSAQNDYANALKNFNIAINRPVEAPAVLDDEISQDVSALPTLDQDLTTALANRYDARVQRLTLKQQDITKTLGNLDALPSVFVDLFANTGRSFSYHELWDYNYGISAGISFDIGFLYFNKYRNRQNTQIANQNAHLEYEQFLRTLRDNVVESRNTLLLKMRSLDISRLRLQTATQKFDATQLKYKNGLMGATDLTVARQELISAQVNYATLLSEVTLSRLRYRYALGEKLYDYQPEE